MGEEDKADRERGGKTTSGNRQAWSSPCPRVQWRTGKDGGNWLRNHLMRRFRILVSFKVRQFLRPAIKERNVNVHSDMNHEMLVRCIDIRLLLFIMTWLCLL